jgi:hypothetical protein
MRIAQHHIGNFRLARHHHIRKFRARGPPPASVLTRKGEAKTIDDRSLPPAVNFA